MFEIFIPLRDSNLKWFCPTPIRQEVKAPCHWSHRDKSCAWAAMPLNTLLASRPDPSGIGNGEGKGTYTWYSASSWSITSEPIKYDTFSQGSHSFTCTSTSSTRNRNEPHTCLCLHSYSWYSFTDRGRMEGWVGLGVWLHNETVYLPEGSHPSHY